MAYPNPTTYTLPFGDKIRVSSRRRFILVRVRNIPDRPDARPFIVLRADVLHSRIMAAYCADTDYMIDQAEKTVTFHFNGKRETHALVPGGTVGRS